MVLKALIHPPSAISGRFRPSHLLLSQDEDSPWFDGMPGSQSLPSALQLPPLVGLPHPIPQGPADADVVPLVLWKG